MDLNASPVRQLEPGCEEWSVVSCYLALCSRTARVKLEALRRITLPQLLSQFEHRSADKMVLPVWVDVRSLGSDNQIEEVCRRGFHISEEGMVVDYGYFTFNDIPIISLADGSAAAIQTRVDDELSHVAIISTHQYLLCDVCVGVSWPLDNWIEANYMKIYSLEKDYDSVVILSQDRPASAFPQVGATTTTEAGTNSVVIKAVDSEIFRGDENRKQCALGTEGKYDKIRDEVQFKSNGQAGVLPRAQFRIGFKIFDSNQIYPRFLCTINTAPTCPEHFAIPLCDECHDRPASRYCTADEASLCGQCDEVLHTGNHILQRHLRTRLNEHRAQDLSGRCEIHPVETVEKYCVLCEIPACPLCESAHRHDEGSTKGSLVALSDAYESALRDLEERAEAERGLGAEPTPFIRDTRAIVSHRRDQLKERIDEIDKIRLQCDNLTAGTRHRLHQLLAAANNDLKVRSESGLVTAVGRQREKIRQSKQAPPDYLRHWAQHCQLMSHLCLADVQDDEINSERELDEVPVSIVISSCRFVAAVGEAYWPDLYPVQQHHSTQSE